MTFVSEPELAGDLTNFSGEEEIALRERTVYRLLLHGGFIR